MGARVRVTCTECTIDREFAVGCGMAGVCVTLRLCRACATFVEQESFALEPDRPQTSPNCPKCGGDTQDLEIEQSREMAWEAPLTACPKCDGQLRWSEIGIWD